MVKHIAIISLSRGLLGEPFVKHEFEIGVRRLEEYGLQVSFTANARRGLAYLAEHPEARAQDLLDAFSDETIDMILCAIGGDDTYRLLPYLFENDQLKKALSHKIFLGFSDTTVNHFMLHKVGLPTFYGQAFLPDVCELDRQMLPYTEHYFKELITSGGIREVRPSEVWYEERSDWSPTAVGTPCPSHKDHGFELLQGRPIFRGKILGGCLESIYDMLDNTTYADTVELCEAYSLFPSLADWKGRILLLETSEDRPSPERYRQMLEKLQSTGIFSVVNGVLCGKPIGKEHQTEYHRIIKEVVADPNLPIVANVNIGHATPRCILPFGIDAEVNADEQVIRFFS